MQLNYSEKYEEDMGDDMDEKTCALKDYLTDSNNIVFFGGAGVSTESGIPDFRSTDGLYNSQYDYPPEMILSHSYFISQTSDFYRFYRDKMIYPNAKPNLAHTTLAKIEQQGKLKAVITQNIDGLHQMAGSDNVIELHGSVQRNFCMDCNAPYTLEFVLQAKDIPICPCGGIIKPDVVLYEEGLNETDISDSINYISNADMLIIGGTSLAVYPAAGLIQYYTGNRLVIINKTKTHIDREANVAIHANIGEVLAKCWGNYGELLT